MVENNVNDTNAETLTEQKKACSAKIKEYFKLSLIHISEPTRH